MNRQYVFLPPYYDRLNAGVDYDGWSDAILRVLKENGVPDGSLLLDLACGTGAFSIRMAKAGYDVIGVDLSPDMLMEARDKAMREELPGILWLCQDMRSFELYGTVGAVICCLDSLNYLLTTGDLAKCFSLVHNYLDPGGIFLFDVSTPHRLKDCFGSSDFVLEAEDVYCGWHNVYHEKESVCDFELSLFVENEDGTYTRMDEKQRERAYSLRTLKDLLTDAGLSVLSVLPSLDGKTELSPGDERWFFVCRKEPASET